MPNPAQKSFKILFLVTEDWYFYTHRLPLAVAAREAGHDVVIATCVACHKNAIEQADLRVIPLQHMNRSSLNPLRELRTLSELYSIYKRERPDLVHQVALKPVVYGTLVAGLVGVPAQVNALAGLGFVFSSNRLLARLLRPFLTGLFRFLLDSPNRRLILQNQHDSDVLVGNKVIRQECVRMIRGAGVDLNGYRARSLPEGPPIIMMASRLLADKGVREFVNAGRIIKREDKVIRFVLVGAPDPGNPATIREDELIHWREEGVIEWWGYQENMPEVIALSTIFVLPSYYGEGLPKVLIEAAACSRAIITTDHPGCRDAIEPVKTGLLVPPRDVQALVDAIRKLLNNPAIREEMGMAGRRLAERAFDVNHVVAQHMCIYDELLERTI